MLNAGKYEFVLVTDIELDQTNPRIKRFLEMYRDEITPERMSLALGAGGDDEGGSAGTTFEKLKQSILTNGGVIQPVILNRQVDGRLICIEGNTRVLIYKTFLEDGTKGTWERIPALVHSGAQDGDIDAIRLQAHLVGPRAWDPYSKAKYLHYLRNCEHLPFSTIIDYCGGRKKEVLEWLNAFSDMEKYYRPILPDDTSFDATRFSGFVELQKPGIKEAIMNANFALSDFAKWIHEAKLNPLNTVRALPRILGSAKARDVFLKRGAKPAISVLESPDLSNALGGADIGQLARALTDKLRSITYVDAMRLKSDPSSETAQYLSEILQELREFMPEDA